MSEGAIERPSRDPESLDPFFTNQSPPSYKGREND